VEILAKASRVQWHEHVLRRDKDHALREVLSFKAESQRKWGQPWKTWMGKVEAIRGIGLQKEDTLIEQDGKIQ